MNCFAIHRRSSCWGRAKLERQPSLWRLARRHASIYLDLEDENDRAKLANPSKYLADHEDELVILDEVHRVPELFQQLRGIIDRGRRHGKANGRFLLLGSAAMDLLKQSGESLAGRISYLELGPFDALEIDPASLETLWVRGGFPRSFLAESDDLSLLWRRNFVRTYLERDISQFGPRIPAETLRRFWTMLAHNQAQILNAATLARGLAVDGKTVAGYLDLLVDLLLVRRLPAWHRNVGKRLVKSPKVYVRDSGIAHALLGIRDKEALLGHPVVGQTWESFVIETLITAAPDGTEAHYYRTSNGTEVDLLLTLPGGELWAIEVKRTIGAEDRARLSFRLRRSESAEAVLRVSGHRAISARRQNGCHRRRRTGKGISIGHIGANSQCKGCSRQGA